MNVTRRGWAVVAVVGFCLLMGWEYGARSLNALVAPLVVVMLAAAITVSRADRPSIDRHPVEEGFIGDRRTIGLSITADAPIAASVEDTVGDGLDVQDGDNVGDLTLAEDSDFSYDARLEKRGVHEIGPATITVRDVLGLAQRRFEGGRDESESQLNLGQTQDRDQEQVRVLVYPKVYDLHGASRRDLQALDDAVREHNREEFDHLREYERGDSLRDVHWKSTAKRADGELVVKEFVADEDLGAVDLVAESTPRRDDEMASAAASVVTYLLEMGVAVGVTAPDGSCPARTGYDHHRSVLRLLARTGAGEATDRERREADILVRADDDGTVVRIDDREIPFDRLCDDALRTAITGGAGESGSDGSGIEGENETGTDTDTESDGNSPGVTA
ncbi:DUF58 domain-containing protein [Natronoglomus mannanivorans]|uniref:DUF58 domain-containing protein n=1 Tax=Natronoglomus mannanivorans TaxID=2979990 RepID=A0AAP2Z2I9_9EURY|nr:DUF58 domain-containing protein [Halobacteria archaeon AArc-xg1-1]